MADDPAKQAADRTVIDVSQEYECRYWSEPYSICDQESTNYSSREHAI